MSKMITFIGAIGCRAIGCRAIGCTLAATYFRDGWMPIGHPLASNSPRHRRMGGIYPNRFDIGVFVQDKAAKNMYN
jgi:hypothetical protein